MGKDVEGQVYGDGPLKITLVKWTNFDTLHQTLNQEPSTSSKYEFEGRVFLIQFYLLLKADYPHTAQLSHITDIHDAKTTPVSKYLIRKHQFPPSKTSRTCRYWHTSIHDREMEVLLILFVNSLVVGVTFWSSIKLYIVQLIHCTTCKTLGHPIQKIWSSCIVYKNGSYTNVQFFLKGKPSHILRDQHVP